MSWSKPPGAFFSKLLPLKTKRGLRGAGDLFSSICFLCSSCRRWKTIWFDTDFGSSFWKNHPPPSPMFFLLLDNKSNFQSCWRLASIEKPRTPEKKKVFAISPGMACPSAKWKNWKKKPKDSSLIDSHADEVMQKVHEEIQELQQEMKKSPKIQKPWNTNWGRPVSVAQLARHLNIEPEQALRWPTDALEQRFPKQWWDCWIWGPYAISKSQPSRKGRTLDPGQKNLSTPWWSFLQISVTLLTNSILTRLPEVLSKENFMRHSWMLFSLMFGSLIPNVFSSESDPAHLPPHFLPDTISSYSTCTYKSNQWSWFRLKKSAHLLWNWNSQIFPNAADLIKARLPSSRLTFDIAQSRN